jgi:hypothetical protein
VGSSDPRILAATFAWQEGSARLSDGGPDDAARRRIVEAVRDELRRRVGTTFTLSQLASEYEQASAWYLDLAQRVAPRQPSAWDPAVALDAAFAMHARQAGDGVWGA